MLIKQKINFDCEIKQSALWSLFFLENLWSQKVQFSLIPELWISFMCLFTLCLFFIQTLQILNFSSCFSQSVTFMCFFRYSGMYSAIGSAFSNKYNFLELCHKFHICDLQAWCGIFQCFFKPWVQVKFFSHKKHLSRFSTWALSTCSVKLCFWTNL